MKKLLLSAVVASAVLASLGSQAASISFGGPVTIEWTVLQQVKDGALVSSNSTHSGSHTTTTLVYKSTTTSFPFGNATFLGLLSNSFNTTFPAGTRLAADNAHVYVVDKTGTNIVLDVSPVVSVQFQNNVGTLTEVVTSKVTPATNTTDTGVITQVSYVSLMYDDSSMTPSDGTHTTFHFDGLSDWNQSINYINGKTSAGFTIMNGAGSGTIRGKASVIKGNTLAPHLNGIEAIF
jgi:hypothetical protein